MTQKKLELDIEMCKFERTMQYWIFQKLVEKLKKILKNSQLYSLLLIDKIHSLSINHITTNRFVRQCSRSKHTFTHRIGDRRPSLRRGGIKRGTKENSKSMTGREEKTRRRRENRTFRRLPREKDEKPWIRRGKRKEDEEKKGTENWKSHFHDEKSRKLRKSLR